MVQEEWNLLEIVLRNNSLRGHPRLVGFIPLFACAIVESINIVDIGSRFSLSLQRSVCYATQAVLKKPLALIGLHLRHIVAAGSHPEGILCGATFPVESRLPRLGGSFQRTVVVGGSRCRSIGTRLQRLVESAVFFIHRDFKPVIIHKSLVA